MHHRFVSPGVLALVAALGGASPPSAAAADGPQPSVTVFPVVTSPDRLPDDLARRVGIVVATLLEKAGLKQLEVAETAWNPRDGDDVKQMGEAFGRHVGQRSLPTDFAVLAWLRGSPGSGVKEIRTIVVDRSGKVVLAESAGQEPLDRAPLRPQDPMSCAVFVSRRLQELWTLDDPLRPDAPQGKMAQFWRDDAGIPAKEELDAITKRAKLLKGRLASASCTVYPLRVGGQSDKSAAAELAAMLAARGFSKAAASEVDPGLKIAGHSNEQRVLWDTARGFREFVRQQPPATDYALFADYAVSGQHVGHVHAIVCDRAGEWVLIEMQNSHHADFARIDPHSPADCHRVLLARLESWLKE